MLSGTGAMAKPICTVESESACTLGEIIDTAKPSRPTAATAPADLTICICVIELTSFSELCVLLESRSIPRFGMIGARILLTIPPRMYWAYRLRIQPDRAQRIHRRRKCLDVPLRGSREVHCLLRFVSLK